MRATSEGGTTWRRSPLTETDLIAAQSAVLLSNRVGYLLRGRTAVLSPFA